MPLRDAYIFFHGRITNWLAGFPTEDQPAQLDSLRDAIYTGLLLVVIDLSQEDDPQIIFESLNARGTPLLESELVKNYLLYLAEIKHLDSKALYDKYWAIFDSDPDEFWQREIKQGRLYRPRVEIFLQHYLVSKTGKEVSSLKLFDAFKAYYKTQEAAGPEGCLQDLQRLAHIFSKRFDKAGTSPEALFFDRLNALDNSTVFPLLLYVFDHYGQPKQATQLREFLVVLESFLVRRMICGLPTQGYNRLMLDLQKAVQQTEQPPTATFRQFFAARASDSEKWPDDAALQRAFLKSPLYERVTRSRLRMVLEALEQQLRTAKSEKVTLPGKLTIEHVLPQSWEQHWPLAQPTPAAIDERNELLHTIGNLSLVTDCLNPALSNSAWETKRTELLKHSILMLNHYFQNVTQWAEDEIRVRSRLLFEAARVVWPGP